MANLTENTQNPAWSAGIYQIETSDPVLGGANGIANRQAKELAARTQWLKTELARAVDLIGTNQQTSTQQFALKTTSVTAGAGLSGGGVLRDNMTLSLGTPSKITATSQNSAVSNTHTHEIDKASTSVAGIVRLNNTLTSTSQTEALTALQGKVLSEQIAAAVAGGFALRGSLGSRNLNDVIGAVNYGVWDNSENVNATLEKNYPTTKAGTLFVLPSAYQGVQLYIPFDLNIIYIRHSLSNDNNNWSSWRIIDETINVLNSDSRTAALSAAMGKKLNDEKLGNSGTQTLNGNLYINRPTAWEKIRFTTQSGFWRFDANPVGDAVAGGMCFNYVFTGADNTEKSRIAFPESQGTSIVAYQEWVTNQINAAAYVSLSGNQTVAGVKTFSSSINVDGGVNISGFFNVEVKGVARGGLEVVAGGGAGQYGTRITVTPAGATTSDRRVGGMTVYDGSIHTQAYGWLHEGFVRSGVGIGQTTNQVRIGWSVGNRLKATVDETDLGNFVFDAQLNTKSTVAVLTGKIAHGGTIPLPVGFSQEQCKWIVSMHNSNPAGLTWDLREGGLGNHHTSHVWADGNRVVTCCVYRDVQAGAGGWQNAEANYMIIGVK